MQTNTSVPVDPELKVFDSETELRKAALGNPNLVNLPDLPDKNCKYCFGKGYTGLKKVLINGKWEDGEYIYCKCLLKNYNKKLKDVNRQLRFGR